MEILKVDKLCKTYGTGDARVEALKAVSLTLEKGEFAAVVGESGSGKSTLLNLVGGLDTPNAGKVFLDGKDLFAMKEKELTVFRRRNIGFIFQGFHLIPEKKAPAQPAFRRTAAEGGNRPRPDEPSGINTGG